MPCVFNAKKSAKAADDKRKYDEYIQSLVDKKTRQEKEKHFSQFDYFFDVPKSECQYCTREFHSPQACKRHEEHCSSTELKWKCDECGKGYKTKEGLTCHQKKHQEFQMLYVCGDCSKVYQSLSELRKHCNLLSHAFPPVEGPVLEDEQRCETCYKVYKKHNMENHMEEHEQKSNKQYKCNKCDYKTTRKNNLTRHLESQHNTWNIDFDLIKKHFESDKVKKSYECPKCKKTCQSYKETVAHLKQKCGEENICKICNIKFTMKQNLKAHVKKKHSNPN